MSISRIGLLLASLSCLPGVFSQPAFCFPTLSKDKLMLSKEKLIKSFNKEKPPPPLVIRDKWAVLIGLNKYRDGKIAPVQSTTANLALLTKALKNANGGRFADDHITTLFDVQATKANAQTMLTEGWLIHKALPNDLILVYVCGRATFEPTDALLCTYETNAESPLATGLSLTQLVAEIHRRTQSKNIVLVADLAPLNDKLAAPPELWQTIANASKVTILASNVPGQPSYKSNSMGTTLFTNYFADGLETGGGAMNLDAIAQYVCQSTTNDAHNQSGQEQRPQYVLLPENKELGNVAIGVPIKVNANSPSRVSFGHPVDQLAYTRPDLVTRQSSHVEAVGAGEGSKDIPKKVSAPDAAKKPGSPTDASKKAAPDPKRSTPPDDDDDDVQDVDFSGYMAKMKRDIQAKWKPPKGLEQRKVVVTYSINRDGSITDGSVVESSGVDEIDKSALEALRSASPLDPLPKGAPKSVQIRYQFDWKVSQ